MQENQSVEKQIPFLKTVGLIIVLLIVERILTCYAVVLFALCGFIFFSFFFLHRGLSWYRGKNLVCVVSVVRGMPALDMCFISLSLHSIFKSLLPAKFKHGRAVCVSAIVNVFMFDNTGFCQISL